MDYLIYLVYVVLALLCGALWQRKNMPFFMGVLVAILVSPLLALVVGILLERNELKVPAELV